MSDTPDYLAWCRNKGYKTEESFFDVLFSLFAWPLFVPYYAFNPTPDQHRHRQYNLDVRNGRWEPYGWQQIQQR